LLCGAVFGCAHPPPPHGAHIVAVSHDVIKVRCNASSESWTLKCTLSADQQWTGTTGNCSASKFTFIIPPSFSLYISLSLPLPPLSSSSPSSYARIKRIEILTLTWNYVLCRLYATCKLTVTPVISHITSSDKLQCINSTVTYDVIR